ncbi:Ig-like domain-containing protein [Leifsonia sp. RAF41]|uniref:Ig-like domain-containing protein n=1 Tax=Leifsonia sp. RAF41 TaxID=3233056 RepID=UPI003F96A134
MSFATVATLAALLLSAVGLIGDAPPAAAASPTTAPQQSATGVHTPATASTVSAAPSAARPADTDPPSSTPSPPPTSRPLTLDALPSGVVTTFPFTVAGSGTPGDVVAVSGGSAPSAAESCQATVDDDQRWSCGIASLPDGPGVAVRAEARSGGSDSGRVRVLHPPVIAGEGVVPTTGGVRGSAYPGASVTVTADTGAACTFPADSNGSWGCVLSGDLTDGRHTVTATQVADFSSQRSATSDRVSIDVDRTAPAAPSITTPTAGSPAPGAPLAFGGAGETGAHVTLYASTDQGAAVVCTADVVAGAWSCQGSLGTGAYTLSALQRDAAGNVSAGSNAVALTVPAGSAAESQSTTRTPTPVPSPTAPVPAAPGAVPPTGPNHPEPRGWLDAPFTTAAAPTVSAEALPGWIRSAGLAVAALLLLVLPARLLAAALARGRRDRARHGGRASVFGRNRPRSDVSDASALFGRPPAASGATARGTATAAATASTAGTSAGGRLPLWPAAAAGLVTAVLVTLSTPVPNAAAYPAVLLAVIVAVAAVNAVWVLAGRGMAPHLHLPVPRVTLRPGLLLVVTVAAIGSRLLGLSPALLFVLVLGLAVGPHAGRARRGRIAALQVSAVAALGVLAWLAVGLVAAPTTPLAAFLSVLVNVLALVGIGSAAVMLLPIGGLAGRAIAQWSRWLWGGLSLVVYTVLFALLLPVASLVERGVGVTVIVGVAVGFAAASVAFWLWERYVAPALDRTLP